MATSVSQARNLVQTSTGLWVPLPAANAANATTGAGVPAAGSMGHDGTNWQRLNALTGSTGQTALLGAPATKVTTFTNTGSGAQEIPSTPSTGYDCTGFKSASIQITAVGTGGNVTFQGSNDGTTWVSVPALVTTTTSTVVFGATAVGIYKMAIDFRYLRLHLTALTSGTFSGTIILSAAPSAPHLLSTVTADTELPSASTLADAASVPSTSIVGTVPHVYTGSALNLLRTATGSDNTTGPGVLAAGAMGWDSVNSVFRRLTVDANGGAGISATSTIQTLTINATGAYTLGDVSRYNYASLQFTGDTAGVLTLEGSNDNSNWFSIPIREITVGVAGGAYYGSISNAFQSYGLYGARVSTKYLRVYSQAYVGVTTGKIFLTSMQGTVLDFTTPAPSYQGAWTPVNYQSLGTTVQTVKSAGGVLGGWFVFNSNASATSFLQLFDTASTVTLGTTVPTMELAIPAGSAANVSLDAGMRFLNGIKAACTTLSKGNAAPTSAVNTNLWYR